MKIDIASARARVGSRYPKPFDEPCRDKTRRRLGLAAGLTQFGVNLLELGPGACSSQRHWHAHEDEFVYVVRGQCNGHHLQNRAASTALILESARGGQGNPHAEYPDIDLRVTEQGYVHKDGRPYS